MDSTTIPDPAPQNALAYGAPWLSPRTSMATAYFERIVDTATAGDLAALHMIEHLIEFIAADIPTRVDGHGGQRHPNPAVAALHEAELITAWVDALEELSRTDLDHDDREVLRSEGLGKFITSSTPFQLAITRQLARDLYRADRESSVGF